jgi:hypothetical protein
VPVVEFGGKGVEVVGLRGWFLGGSSMVVKLELRGLRGGVLEKD